MTQPVATGPAAAGEETQVVVFQVADEYYAVKIDVVREVVHAATYHVTPVPRMPSYLCGITNLRGRIVPVMDLRVRLGLTARVQGGPARIAVTETSHGLVGMVVDGVSEVLRLSPADVEAMSQAMVLPELEAARGVVRSGGRLITLLDLERVLARDERGARIEGGAHAVEV